MAASAVVSFGLSIPTATAAGVLTFGSLAQCLRGVGLSMDECRISASNAQAEFDERAPHFADRSSCERRFGGGRCSIGFVGPVASAARSHSVFFTPRQDGFVVSLRSAADRTVVPLVVSGGIAFVPRTITRLQTGHVASPAVSVPVATHARGEAPLTDGRPVTYPKQSGGFDCAAVLDPALGGSPGTGCLPTHPR